MSTWVVEHGMVPLLVPEVFPPVDFSMQAHVFFGDTWHHPYISTCFCGKRFYFPIYTDAPPVLLVHVGLAQAHPNYIYRAIKMAALEGTVLERLKSSLVLFRRLSFERNLIRVMC